MCKMSLRAANLIASLYPSSIITMRSALVIHGLLEKEEGDLLDLSFPRGSYRKKDPQIHVWILAPHLHPIGANWVEKGENVYFLYDLSSLCALYLLSYYRREISEVYFSEGISAIRRAIYEKREKVEEICARLYLYPEALSLLSLFRKYILATA